MINRMSPVLVDTYMTRREASPLEQIRTKFIEQPFKLRGDIFNNFGKKRKPEHVKTRSSIYDSVKNHAQHKSFDSAGAASKNYFKQAQMISLESADAVK